MTKYWSRENTKNWIAQLEHRIEDIEYYLRRTIEWCESNEVYDDKLVLACAVMTASWVSFMRQEPLSKQEIFEILNVSGWQDMEDGIFEFNPDYAHLEHEELLAMIVNHYD